jgi:hypothetical protein
MALALMLLGASTGSTAVVMPLASSDPAIQNYSKPLDGAMQWGAACNAEYRIEANSQPNPCETRGIEAADVDSGHAQPSDQSVSSEAAGTAGSNPDAAVSNSDAAQPTTPAAEDQGRDSGYHPGEPNGPYGENRDGDSSKQEQPEANAVTPSQGEPGENVQEPAHTSEASAPSEEPKMPAQDADNCNQSDDKPSSGEAANTSDSNSDAKGSNSDAAGANSGSSDAAQPTTPAAEDQGRDSGYQPGEPNGPYGENRNGETSKEPQPEANAVTPSQGEPGENVQEPAHTSEASAPSEEPKMPAQDADNSNQSGDKSSSGEAANTSDSNSDAKGSNSDAAGANSGSSDAAQPTTPAAEDQGRDSGYQPGEPNGPYGENRDGESSKAPQPEANAVTPTGDAASSASVEGGSTERPEGLKADSEQGSGTTEDFDDDIDEASVGAPSGAVSEPSATLRDSQDAASHTAILSVMGGWIGQATERVGQVLRLVSGELSSKG